MILNELQILLAIELLRDQSEDEGDQELIDEFQRLLEVNGWIPAISAEER